MKPFWGPRNGVTLYHADCREVLPGLADKSAGLVLTDPPYAVSKAGVTHVRQSGMGSRRLDFFAGDADWNATIRLWLEVLYHTTCIIADDASVYAWVGHREFGPTVSLLEREGMETRFLVWAKACPAPPPPGSGWPSGAELCVFGYRQGKRCWTHTGSNPPPRSNVFEADSFRFGQPGKEDHPTQKPLSVLAPLIEASSIAGDLVLDPFAGSGSTLVAAYRLQRRAIGIEIEERYCEVAAKRLEREMAQGDLFRRAP